MLHKRSLTLFSCLAAGPILILPLEASAVEDSQVRTLRIVSKPSGIARKHSVQVEAAEQGVTLTGTIEKWYHNRRRHMGHVDVDLLDAKGEVVTTQGVCESDELWRRHQQRKLFRTLISDLPGDAQALRIRHERGQLDTDSHPC